MKAKSTPKKALHTLLAVSMASAMSLPATSIAFAAEDDSSSSEASSSSYAETSSSADIKAFSASSSSSNGASTSASASSIASASSSAQQIAKGSSSATTSANTEGAKVVEIGETVPKVNSTLNIEKPEGASLTAEAVLFSDNGLTYAINPAKQATPAQAAAGQPAEAAPTVTFLGFSEKPKANLTVPSQVTYNQITYAVTGFSNGAIVAQTTKTDTAVTPMDPSLEPSSAVLYAAKAKAAAQSVTEQAKEIKTISLPATIETIDAAAFAAYPNLHQINVSKDNKAFKSYNGMLFSNDLRSLVVVPEGIEGTAVLPDVLQTIPACAFSRCAKLTGVSVTGATPETPAGSPEAEAAKAASPFATQDGILYTADKAALLAAPAGLGASVTIAPECAEIVEGALVGNTDLRTVVVLGEVQSVATAKFDKNKAEKQLTLSAFADDVVKEAKVIINDGLSQDAWRNAGFANFDVLPQPGSTSGPANGQSGFLFTLLPSYTLSVAWVGNGAPEADLQIPAAGVINNNEFTVTHIAENAFAGQQSIQMVTAPDTLTEVGNGAFNGCSNLKTVQLPNNVQTIGEEAFASTGLLSIVLPTELQTVGSHAFSGLNGTTIVELRQAPNVSDQVVTGSTGLSVYVPFLAPVIPDGASAGEVEALYVGALEACSWNIGLPSGGNHLYPYGVKFGAEVYDIEAGDTVDLYSGNGYWLAPGNVQTIYSYKAQYISIDPQTGLLTAKQAGNSNLNVALKLSVQEMNADGEIVDRVVELEPATKKADSAA